MNRFWMSLIGILRPLKFQSRPCGFRVAMGHDMDSPMTAV